MLAGSCSPASGRAASSITSISQRRRQYKNYMQTASFLSLAAKRRSSGGEPPRIKIDLRLICYYKVYKALHQQQNIVFLWQACGMAGEGVLGGWRAACQEGRVSGAVGAYLKVDMLCDRLGGSMYIQKIIGMSAGPAGVGVEERIRRINQRKEKYKRSTNNSHKKFICVARKLLYKLCSYAERELFEKEFEPYQNSRVYYFVILAHVKIRMDPSERDNFSRNLTALLHAKVHTYNEEIRRTNNKNFINFRFEEIADIEFALKALAFYLQDRVAEAIEVIYKKEKGFVLKKQQFEMALGIVGDLQQRLRAYPPGELFPYFNEKTKKIDVPKEKPSGSRNKKEEDEEWVEERTYRESYRHTIRRQRRREAIGPPKQQQTPKTPLLSLENSYPINPHFYSVLFSYPDPQNQQPQPTPSYQPNFSFNFGMDHFPPGFTPERYDYPASPVEAEEESIKRVSGQLRIKNQYYEAESFSHLHDRQHRRADDRCKVQLVPPRSTGETIKKLEDVDYICEI